MVRAEQPDPGAADLVLARPLRHQRAEGEGRRADAAPERDLPHPRSGSFTDLARALIVDPALLVWLDGNDNTAKAPNENLAREFMELFALGHGHFSEADVKEAARALTGWKVDRQTGEAMLRAEAARRRRARPCSGRPATSAPTELVDVLLGQPASAEFVVGRLWFRLVVAEAPSAATTGEAAGRVRERARHRRHAAGDGRRRRSSATRRTALVKQPVEWVGRDGAGAAASQLRRELAGQDRGRRLLVGLRGMGQVPFRPPSVGGWPAGAGWLTTAPAAARLATARLLAAEGRPLDDPQDVDQEPYGGDPPAAGGRRLHRPDRGRHRRSPTDRPTRRRWPRSPLSTSSPAEGAVEPEPTLSTPSTP